MVAFPTVLYFGDEQISGGPAGGSRAILGSEGSFWQTVLGQRALGTGWGMYRHSLKLNKLVPSGADGVTPPPGSIPPYWDGTYGQWVAFHPVPTGQINNLLPLAYGDNWYEGSVAGLNNGAVTPMAPLMHSFWERWGDQNPGFKVIKKAYPAGFGGSGGFKSTGAAYADILSTINTAVAALTPGDTLDVRAIIIDCSTTDLFNTNLTYLADATSFVQNIRASLEALTGVTCASTTPIVMVNHHQDMLATTANATRALRRFNADIARDNANVYLFDMNWAEDWQQSGILASSFPLLNQPGVEVVNKRYYAPETYLQAGLRMGRALDAIWAGTPPVTPGSAIPVVVMIGDSQFVGTIDPLLAFLTDQESILGPVGGTDRDFQWIWDNENNLVAPYDVMANSNTYGTVSAAFFGPDSTLLKRMAERFPTGLVLFKYARNGVALTLEANGTANAVEPDAGTIWVDIRSRWQLFKQECLQQLGRSPDCVGLVTDLGSNDEGTLSAYTAFAAKVGTFIEEARTLFGTRSTGGELPIVWLQPPPHVDSGGNSTHNNNAGATAVRGTIAGLANAYDNLSVILNPGASKYELKRGENVHYGGEANLQIGYDLADALIALIEANAGGSGATTGEGVDESAGVDGPPSEGASFEVEEGTASATANSYASVEFATVYHETYGNPSNWTAADLPAQQDALRQATLALDLRYGNRWSGYRYSSAQALDWPRTYAVDSAGNEIESDTVPVRLQQATAMLALLHLIGEDINPLTRTSADIRSESLTAASGASKSVTYAGSKPVEAQLVRIDRMLQTAGLIAGGGGWGWLDV